jgi:hypothetical protein
VERERQVDPFVHALLVGQLDAEADRRHARVAGALVGGFHDARAAARDDREPFVAELARELPRLAVLRRPRIRAGRSEDRDGLADVRQRREALAQLVLDAKEPLGVGELGEDRARLGLQQLLVGGAGMAGRVPLV